ncbi:MAG: hypothetical protein AAFZ89_14715 [Bacteroidota bacterium]
MKKVASILAVVLFSMGLISCESESTAETDALFDIEASEEEIKSDDRE